VVVVDANVLLYAVNEDAPHHRLARSWLDGALAGPEPVGFAWIVLLAFLRLTTRPGLFPQPLTLDQATATLRLWLAAPAAVQLAPTPRHLDQLHTFLQAVGTAANHVSDAHLAALAVEHSARVVSFDSDFSRFPGLRWERPGA
jgi:toxin-antitoxin system PIN domain toxin